MKKLNRIKAKNIVISFVLLIATQFIISLLSPLLPHFLVCLFVIILLICYNVYYILALFNKHDLEDTDKDFILFGMGVLVIVIPLSYALIYNSFYNFNNKFFFVSGNEKLNVGDFYYFSISTFATVGYGDIVAKSTSLRMIVTLEIINGIVLLIFGVSNIDFIKNRLS